MREKRKFVRLHAPIGLVYKTLRKHKRTKTHRTLLKDIGGGGASFVPQEELRCGELLQMEIQIPNLAVPWTRWVKWSGFHTAARAASRWKPPCVSVTSPRRTFTGFWNTCTW